MTGYKELIDELRSQSCRLVNVDYFALKLIEEAANAIEELSKRLDKINSLTHNGYYTGTYIKALMEIEE